MSTDHPQKPVYYEGNEIFSVDEKLQNLIQFLINMGFETFNSCQDNIHDLAWIELELQDWQEINQLAFLSESRELMEYITEACIVELLSTDNGHPDENDEYWIEGENLIWSVSIRFPKEDIERFEQLIRFTLEHIWEHELTSVQ